MCLCCGTVKKREKKTRVYVENASVCTFKTSPCVPAPSPHVSYMWAWCRYTRGRFECTHGGAFDADTRSPSPPTHTQPQAAHRPQPPLLMVPFPSMPSSFKPLETNTKTNTQTRDKRQRQTDRQTETDRQRQTEIHTHKQTHTHTCPRCTLPLSSIPHTEKHWLADMCGHPSTQKGPSTAHTAEIKVVHARLKRARELGIQVAPVVPVNYDVPRQLHEQRTRVDRRAGQQEEQEPGRVEADRQSGLQAPPARRGQSDVLPLSREVPRSSDAAQGCRRTLQEQSAGQGPTSSGPQQKSDPDGSTVELDGDTRLHATLRDDKGGGRTDQLSPHYPSQTEPDRPTQRTQDYSAVLQNSAADGTRSGNLLLLRGKEGPKQARAIIQPTATVSVDRDHNSRLLRTGSRGCRKSARSATKGSLVQVTLDRYAVRNVPELSADQNVGVRAAVPPHHAYGADEEETALSQLSS